MAGTFYDLLPPAEPAGSDELLGRFLDYVAGKGLTLYPAQEEAVIVGVSTLAALNPAHVASRLEPREALHHVS